MFSQEMGGNGNAGISRQILSVKDSFHQNGSRGVNECTWSRRHQVVFSILHIRRLHTTLGIAHIMVMKRIKRDINMKLRMKLLTSCFLLVERKRYLHRLHKFCSNPNVSGATV